MAAIEHFLMEERMSNIQRNGMTQPSKDKFNPVLIDLSESEDDIISDSPNAPLVSSSFSANAGAMDAAASLVALASFKYASTQDVDKKDGRSTDLKIATLASLFLYKDIAVLLKLLVAAEGSVDGVPELLCSVQIKEGKKSPSDTSSTSQEGRNVRPSYQAPESPSRPCSTSRNQNSPESPMQRGSPRSFDAQMLDYLYGNDAPKTLERKHLTDSEGNLWQLITEIEGGRRVYKRGNWRNEDQFEGEPMILPRS